MNLIMYKSLLIFFILTFEMHAKKAKRKDFYEILGLKRNANAKQIKKAYRTLVKEYHPDNNKERANWAKNQFIEVTKAYETLSDPEKRRVYDMGGEDAVDEAE